MKFDVPEKRRLAQLWNSKPLLSGLAPCLRLQSFSQRGILLGTSAHVFDFECLVISASFDAHGPYPRSNLSPYISEDLGTVSNGMSKMNDAY